MNLCNIYNCLEPVFCLLFCNIAALRPTNNSIIQTEFLQQHLTQAEFLSMVNTYRNLLYKVCNIYTDSAEDREDLYQEIIFQLWKSSPLFRGEAKFSTWLYRIALNTAISGLRKKKKQPAVASLEISEALADIPQNAENDEQVQLLYAAIAKLTDIEKALVMLYLEDKPYEEMEEILGINQNSLRVKMNRAKEKLRTLTKQMSYGT
jgi:RNA polymerase sigma-70 factor (ECF subfamily)